MTKNFRAALDEQMKDPEFSLEWEMLEPEYQIIKAMLDARSERNMTQKDLAKASGIAQGDISKLENGNANPSVRTLQRLAAGLGKRLKLSFEPIESP